MKEENRGALPVVDKNNKVIGIITDRNICLSLASKNGKPHSEMNIQEILPKFKLRTVKPEDEISTALEQMRKNRVSWLPVTDAQGRLKGMITVNTLLSRALAKKTGVGKTIGKGRKPCKDNQSLVRAKQPEKIIHKKPSQLRRLFVMHKTLVLTCRWIGCYFFLTLCFLFHKFRPWKVKTLLMTIIYVRGPLS